MPNTHQKNKEEDRYATEGTANPCDCLDGAAAEPQSTNDSKQEGGGRQEVLNHPEIAEVPKQLR